MTTMAENSPVTVERRGSAGHVVLPAAAVEASGELIAKGVAAAVKGLQRDPDLRCIVIEGTKGSFRGRSAGTTAAEALAAGILGLRTVPLPTVAVLDGEAYGTGASLLLACDLRLATSDSTLVLSQTELGLGPGATWELERTLGRARSLELLYTGRTLGAPEALALGLLTGVAPGDGPATLLADLVSTLEARPRNVLAAAKRSLLHAEGAGLEEALEYDVLLAESLRLGDGDPLDG
jgi:enoyl-CoA hydratase/carnithine racemase